MSAESAAIEVHAGAQMAARPYWAMLPAAYAQLRQAVMIGASGEVLGAGPPRMPPRGADGVGLLRLYGPLMYRPSWMLDLFGGTSTLAFAQEFRAALADPTVKAIVIDVDSPGGEVYGIDELAAEIRAARGSKPIVAVANPLAASAAYYVASQADEIVVIPSGEVGSIGVFAGHVDFSRALDADGIKVSLISAGKYKVEGNPFEPLSDEARAAIQAVVDDYYGAFVRAVARGRNASVNDVRSGFGEGRVVVARRALELGMADRIGTLGDVVRGAMRQSAGNAAPRPAAATDWNAVAARIAAKLKEA